MHYGQEYIIQTNQLILTLSELRGLILNAVDKGILDENYLDKIDEITDIRKIYPNFDQMVKELQQSNCGRFRELISHPTIIFINKVPTLINYDYDLAVEFPDHVGYPIILECDKQLKPIRENLNLKYK